MRSERVRKIVGAGRGVVRILEPDPQRFLPDVGGVVEDSSNPQAPRRFHGRVGYAKEEAEVVVPIDPSLTPVFRRPRDFREFQSGLGSSDPEAHVVLAKVDRGDVEPSHLDRGDPGPKHFMHSIELDVEETVLYCNVGTLRLSGREAGLERIVVREERLTFYKSIEHAGFSSEDSLDEVESEPVGSGREWNTVAARRGPAFGEDA